MREVPRKGRWEFSPPSMREVPRKGRWEFLPPSMREVAARRSRADGGSNSLSRSSPCSSRRLPPRRAPRTPSVSLTLASSLQGGRQGLRRALHTTPLPPAMREVAARRSRADGGSSSLSLAYARQLPPRRAPRAEAEFLPPSVRAVPHRGRWEYRPQSRSRSTAPSKEGAKETAGAHTTPLPPSVREVPRKGRWE